MEKIIKILLVEDEVLIAHDIKEIIEQLGSMLVSIARDYDDALTILSKEEIDLCILDIKLKGEKSGVDIANHINTSRQIPLIYLTSYSDAETIEAVKHTNPAGFLLKPVSKDQILASIEIALHKIKVVTEKTTNNFFITKDKSIFTKVHFDDVLWIESYRNYVTIKTDAKKYTVRMPLKKAFEMLPKENFIKCNKQFVVNIKQVDRFSSDELIIKSDIIPISRQAQKEVLLRLKQFSS